MADNDNSEHQAAETPSTSAPANPQGPSPSPGGPPSEPFWWRDFIANGTAVCFWLTVLYVLYKATPDNLKDIILILVGALIGYMSCWFNFKYGSSEGSAKKTAALTDMVKQNGSGQ